MLSISVNYIKDNGRASLEVLLNPLTIARNENEKVLIEPSVNSIRLSIKIKQADEIERKVRDSFRGLFNRGCTKLMGSLPPPPGNNPG